MMRQIVIMLCLCSAVGVGGEHKSGNPSHDDRVDSNDTCRAGGECLSLNVWRPAGIAEKGWWSKSLNDDEVCEACKHMRASAFELRLSCMDRRGQAFHAHKQSLPTNTQFVHIVAPGVFWQS